MTGRFKKLTYSHQHGGVFATLPNTHAVPTSKRVKHMVKAWFSVFIYQTFKAFIEAMNRGVGRVPQV